MKRGPRLLAWSAAVVGLLSVILGAVVVWWNALSPGGLNERVLSATGTTVCGGFVYVVFAAFGALMWNDVA